MSHLRHDLVEEHLVLVVDESVVEHTLRLVAEQAEQLVVVSDHARVGLQDTCTNNNNMRILNTCTNNNNIMMMIIVTYLAYRVTYHVHSYLVQS